MKGNYLTSLYLSLSSINKDNNSLGISPMAQWLRLYASNVGGAGSVPGRGTNMSHRATRRKENSKLIEL